MMKLNELTLERYDILDIVRKEIIRRAFETDEDQWARIVAATKVTPKKGKLTIKDLLTE